MEIEEFKKIVSDVLASRGFVKKGSYYYNDHDDLTIVIGIQKSSFGESLYINVGYVIKQLNPGLEKPRDVDGNVRTRFSFAEEPKTKDVFDLDDLGLDQSRLTRIIEENIHEYKVGSLEELKALIQKKPVMLYQTTLNAKTLLGFETT